MSWANYQDKVRRYFPFSNTEWKNFGVLVFVFALMWSFDRWGTTTFDAQEGIKNFLIAAITIGVVVFVHHAAQRLLGIWYGYRIEHKIWWIGLIAGMLITVLTFGDRSFFIFAASVMQAHFMPAHRLGTFRYGPSLRQIGSSAFVGPIAAVTVSFLLYLIAPSVFRDMLDFSLYFGLFNLLPIPPLDGFQVFVGTRAAMSGGFWYKFLISAGIGFFLVYFLTGLGLWWSLALATIIGIGGWLALEAFDL